jgi:hypothetical protein
MFMAHTNKVTRVYCINMIKQEDIIPNYQSVCATVENGDLFKCSSDVGKSYINN